MITRDLFSDGVVHVLGLKLAMQARHLCRSEIRNSVSRCAKGKLMSEICNIVIFM